MFFFRKSNVLSLTEQHAVLIILLQRSIPPPVIRSRLQAEQPAGIAAQDLFLLPGRDFQLVDGAEHFSEAADLVGIVAAGQNMPGACKIDTELQGQRIEIDGIEIKIFQVGAGRL